MATWIGTEGLIALTTASLLYGMTWYALRAKSARVRWGARTLLLVIVFSPALWVALVGRGGLYGDAGPRAPARTVTVATAEPAKVAPAPASPAAATAGAPAIEPPLPVQEHAATAGGAAPPDPQTWDVVRVFYGTDRAQFGDGKRLLYGSSRAGRLELGQVEVTVPRLHQAPSIERPWVVRLPFTTVSVLEQPEDPQRHFTIRDIRALSPEAFLALVRQRLATAKAYAKRAVVFIHGYNTDFDFAIFRTAQMVNDLKFDGAPFLYSWPSSQGVTGYVYDRDSAEQAEPHLKAFLKLVVAESGAKSIMLIAHSMGNQPMLRVLRDLQNDLPDGVKVDQVVLAAPDVDRDVFEQLARSVARDGRGITLYASRNDRAMTAARVVAGGVPRAGDVPTDGPVIIPGIDTIDISKSSSDGLALNHSVYAQSRVLIGDIAMLIATGLRPPVKRLPSLETVTTARGIYWRVP